MRRSSIWPVLSISLGRKCAPLYTTPGVINHSGWLCASVKKSVLGLKTVGLTFIFLSSTVDTIFDYEIKCRVCSFCKHFSNKYSINSNGFFLDSWIQLIYIRLVIFCGFKLVFNFLQKKSCLYNFWMPITFIRGYKVKANSSVRGNDNAI